MDAALILIACDAATAQALQVRLQRLGYRAPEIATSSAEALALAQAVSPALVMLDIHWVRDAYELIHVALRIPVIEVAPTGYTPLGDSRNVTFDPTADDRALQLAIDLALTRTQNAALEHEREALRRDIEDYKRGEQRFRLVAESGRPGSHRRPRRTPHL